MVLRQRVRRLYDLFPLPYRVPAGVRVARQFNEQFQWWEPEAARAYQLRRVRELLRHAAENVPYYASLFHRLGFRPEALADLAGLRALPILEKQTVREQQEALTARNAAQFEPALHTTGGTTGQRLQVLVGRRSRHAHAADRERHYHWGGYEPGQPMAVFARFLCPVQGAERYHERPRRWLYFNAQQINEEELGAILRRTARFRPFGLIAFPSHLYWIYQYLSAHPLEGIRPRVLMTDAEMLYAFQRAEIEKFFDARIYDFYGMSEQAAGAAQCEAGQYHVSAEYTYVEVLRPDGTPAAPGETGEIVGTNFENYAMPLIRYRTGDLATVGEGACPCGRTLPVLREIAGRTQDLIVTPKGITRFPNWRFTFHETRAVKEVQIVQEAVQRFRIRAVTTPEFGTEDANILTEALVRCFDYPIEVSMELVASLPRTARGKLRLVQCEVPATLWNGDTQTARA